MPIACPNCGVNFNLVTDDGQTAAATPAGGDAATSINGDTCPKCGQAKTPGYRLCRNCQNERYTATCPTPGCNRGRDPQFELCYGCEQDKRNAAAANAADAATASQPAAATQTATAAPPDDMPWDDEDDLPF